MMMAAVEDGATSGGPLARGYAAVLGDVVASREADAELFTHLNDALDHVNERIVGIQPFQVTIGDEFQGIYPRLGQALNATLLVRLLLHDTTEVRFGLGWGALTRWNAARAPYEQDGPAWWAAREALDAVDRQDRGSGMPAGWRTAIRFGPSLPDAATDRAAADTAAADTAAADGVAPDEHAGSRPEDDDPPVLVPVPPGLDPPLTLDLTVKDTLDGMVMLRDQLLSRFDDRDVGLVLALLEGVTVTQAAERLGISQQAASRRLRTNGGYALIRSWHLLEGAD